MLGIGWVMFWKAIAVSVAGAIAWQWDAFKTRRNGEGVVLRQDKRTGVYRPSDWPERFEKWCRRLIYFVAALFCTFSVLFIGSLLYSKYF